MKISLKKETIQFSLIYLGHKNKNDVKKDTIQFPLIYVGHKINTMKKRHNTFSVDLC